MRLLHLALRVSANVCIKVIQFFELKYNVMKMNEKQIKTIAWFKDKLQNNELNFDTCVKLFDLLMDSIDVMSISAYAKKNGISYNGTLSRIDSGRLNAISLHGDTFVFDTKKTEPTEILQ